LKYHFSDLTDLRVENLLTILLSLKYCSWDKLQQRMKFEGPGKEYVQGNYCYQVLRKMTLFNYFQFP
jgi:hypothetical protein